MIGINTFTRQFLWCFLALGVLASSHEITFDGCSIGNLGQLGIEGTLGMMETLLGFS